MSQLHSGNILRSGSETFLRVLFGLFLAFVAIALATLPNPVPFAAVTVVMALFASREWHRLVRSPAQRDMADQQPIHIQTIITVASIACAVAALVLRVAPAALAFLAIGTVAAFVVARQRNDNPLWHGGGVLYIGLPSCALVALKALPSQGTWYILGLFLIVWATDTGALVFGKLIGGTKIAPRISPGKTWAGTIGGSITAAAVFAAYIAFFSFNVLAAVVFAVGLSIVAHLGDLFESWVKRRFGTKDSGGLIPGHGGVLDRMDSIFAASVVLALLVFGLHLNPLFGGHA
ncbi:MAG: phosphatidate cytidylyltransferase [Alphaproteobacteria bacterium]|nr:phosphatidate cytidylyltransferase [Alphaproteobacteria bacterium]